jgi:hypothetical protein
VHLTYDLSIMPFTWDFFTWLVIYRARGMAIVNFNWQQARSTKWGWDESKNRFHNYMFPGPKLLADMPVTIDHQDALLDPQALLNRRQDLPKDYERLYLREPRDCPGVRYTVTLRRTFHKPDRNSDPEVWREFARRIAAHVIEDSQDRPITLHDRYSLYAAARQNYSVPNGPTSVLEYTPYAFCQVADPSVRTALKSWAGHGVKVGDKIETLLPNQHIVWARPTLEGLLAVHEQCG